MTHVITEKWRNTIGWIFLFLYCFSLLQYIPIINHISILLEIGVIALFLPQLYEDFRLLNGKLKNLLWIPCGFVLIFLLQTVLWDSLLFPNLFPLNIKNGNQEMLGTMLTQHKILYLAGTILIGPILEEILYRLVCFGDIQNKSILLAHLITSLLFGFQHIVNAALWQGDYIQLLNMPSYMIFSLVLTFIYKKTKNIWICIGIHMLNNCIGVILIMGTIH